MRRVFAAMIVLSLSAGVGLAQGNNTPQNNQGSQPPQQNPNNNPQNPGTNPPQPGANPSQPTGNTQAYLGVALEPLNPALASQMPGVVPQGEGVVVARVVPDSPAAKAGLRDMDIVLSVDGKKVHNPEELTRVIRQDQPGTQVEIAYVRAGKAATAKATLGQRPMAPMLQQNPNVFRFQPDERFREMFEESEAANDKGVWESFDAMKLARLDDKRWKAEIEYRNKDQKKEHKTFEGTISEIRKKVQTEKDLPQNERMHLLHALNPNGSVFEFHFPPFGPSGSNLRDGP